MLATRNSSVSAHTWCMKEQRDAGKNAVLVVTHKGSTFFDNSTALSQGAHDDNNNTALNQGFNNDKNNINADLSQG